MRNLLHCQLCRPSLRSLPPLTGNDIQWSSQYFIQFELVGQYFSIYRFMLQSRCLTENPVINGISTFFDDLEAS